jgi:hypothetical protein
MIALLRWFGGLGWIGLLLLFVAVPAVGFCFGTPPLLRMPPGWVPPILERQDGGSRAGLGRRQQVGEITWVDLAGSPQELGAAHGMLMQERIAGLESDLVNTLIERVPSFPARHVLLGLVGLNNRSLPGHFLARELQEIRAATAAPDPTTDSWRILGPAYQRAVHYHALHDVSQYLIDNPLVRPIQVGCSAFAATAPRTTDGHMIVGRLFDFEGGPRFDLDKVVFTVRPANGLRFMHVAWSGMTGAVTGMNEAGLWVSINAADSAGLVFCGRPIVMVVREILQDCRTIDEAIAVLTRSQVFVSDGVLIASAKENRSVIAELGPTGLGIRPAHDGLVVLTNHFLAERWKGDVRNRLRMERGTTTVRMARLHELLEPGAITPERAVAVLRDRHGAGGRDVGFNNRSTINAWIGAHLAVADLTRGVMWVSEPRHGLGTMRAFTLDGPAPELDLPADPEWERCRVDLPRWQALRARLIAGITDPEERARCVAELLRLNPQGFESHWLAGLASTDPAARHAALTHALTLQPAYPEDAERIRTALSGGHGSPPTDPPSAP